VPNGVKNFVIKLFNVSENTYKHFCKTSNSSFLFGIRFSSLFLVNVFHPESGLKKLLNEYLSLIWH